jgi:hypothetical protein
MQGFIRVPKKFEQWIIEMGKELDRVEKRQPPHQGKLKMMTIAQAKTATLDQLTEELAAAGWDSTQTTVEEAREAVMNLLAEYGVTE